MFSWGQYFQWFELKNHSLFQMFSFSNSKKKKKETIVVFTFLGIEYLELNTLKNNIHLLNMYD